MSVAVGADGHCDSASGCSLGAAVAWAAVQTGTLVRLELESGEYQLDAPLTFDGSFGASEVMLSAPIGAEVVLRPSSRRRLQNGATPAALLNVSAGVLTLERVQGRTLSAYAPESEHAAHEEAVLAAEHALDAPWLHRHEG